MVEFKLHNLTILVGFDAVILTEFQPPTTNICYNVHENAEWWLNGNQTYREDAILAVASTANPVTVTLSETTMKNAFSAYYKKVELQISEDVEDDALSGNAEPIED